jgi:hypothetical protein
MADAERDTHAAGFRELVQLIDGLRGEHTIAMLKADIAEKARSPVRDAMQNMRDYRVREIGPSVTPGRVVTTS